MIEPIGLRSYVDAMFAEKEKALQAALLAQEKAVQAALDASDKAITKAEVNAEKWREAANEWRGAMSDRDRELPSRREVESSVDAVADRLSGLVARLDKAESAVASLQGRSLALAGFGAVVGGIAVKVLGG